MKKSTAIKYLEDYFGLMNKLEDNPDIRGKKHFDELQRKIVAIHHAMVGDDPTAKYKFKKKKEENKQEELF